MKYKIKLDIFEGPLDLLLYLIQKNEINVHDIPITLVTEQYLEYLNVMQTMNLEIAGEFLVMASMLMRIKSKMLLPVQDQVAEAETEEDPRDELVHKLLEYMKFKEAAKDFKVMEEARAGVFLRTPQDIDVNVDALEFEDISLMDLIGAFNTVLKEMPQDIYHNVINDEFTVAQKVEDLLDTLKLCPKIKFSQLFDKTTNKIEAITIFLALLELTRLKEIKFKQDNVYGEIEIIKNQPIAESAFNTQELT